MCLAIPNRPSSQCASSFCYRTCLQRSYITTSPTILGCQTHCQRCRAGTVCCAIRGQVKASWPLFAGNSVIPEPGECGWWTEGKQYLIVESTIIGGRVLDAGLAGQRVLVEKKLPLRRLQNQFCLERKHSSSEVERRLLEQVILYIFGFSIGAPAETHSEEGPRSRLVATSRLNAIAAAAKRLATVGARLQSRVRTIRVSLYISCSTMHSTLDCKKRWNSLAEGL